MTVSEDRRRQNREAQARRRVKLAKVKAQRASVPATASSSVLVASLASPSASPASTIPVSEYVRAGQIAGLLEAHFRSGMSMHGDQAMHAWLVAHPVGQSVVLELLSVAGLGDSFRLWRGWR